MKKPKNAPRRRRIQEVTSESLERVSGGGLTGPDQCVPQYTLICISEYVPPTTQEA